MGISINVYTVFGVKLPWHDDFMEAYDVQYDMAQELCIIPDGMGGNYIVLGVLLYDSGDFRYGEDGDDFKEIDVSDLAQKEIEYKEKFLKEFPNFPSLIEDPFKILVFKHYA